MRIPRQAALLFLTLLLGSCLNNNPYPPEETNKNIFYDTFTEEPRHLDPARAYSSDEYKFMNQIYEPVVGYHYLKRPFRLIPLTCEEVPLPSLLDKEGNKLPKDAPAEQVAKVVYEIKLKTGIRYQDHPCFAKEGEAYKWHLESASDFPKIQHPNELDGTGTRELLAEDYAYQIKRMAHPQLECPILPILTSYIDGLSELYEEIKAELTRIRNERRAQADAFYNQEADEKENPIYLDLRKFKLRGVEVVDRHTYRITLKQPYPQFAYWLAMPFFSPIPWEADRFYTQGAASRQNITLDRFPVGTGAYTLAVSRPNFRIILKKNPNFRDAFYPSEGSEGDQEAGLLEDAGKKVPFIEEAIFVLEKESIPEWNKFIQGYYDTSGIQSDVFDQAVNLSSQGPELTDFLKDKGIVLRTATDPSTFYFAFNMLDDIVGGYTEEKQKLRQAISIALDIEEFTQIFLNGRGEAAQSPIPPGISGYQSSAQGINPYVYDWDEERDQPRRKSTEEAKRLMTEAGYPNGRDLGGKQLVLFYDAVSGGAGDKAYYDWLRKQFRKIDVDLQFRITDYNQFQEKVLKGNFQILRWGWNADYPDPENFLFLLQGAQGKVKAQGENAANYDNAEFNKLFEKMANMEDSPERMKIIDSMLTIVRKDAPWMFGWHPRGYGLFHGWFKNYKPMAIGGSTLQYKRIDTVARAEKQTAWNKPVTWPLWGVLLVLIAGTLPAIRTIRKQEKGG